MGIKAIFPHLTDSVIIKSLLHYKMDYQTLITAILDDNVPPHLCHPLNNKDNLSGEGDSGNNKVKGGDSDNDNEYKGGDSDINKIKGGDSDNGNKISKKILHKIFLDEDSDDGTDHLFENINNYNDELD